MVISAAGCTPLPPIPHITHFLPDEGTPGDHITGIEVAAENYGDARNVIFTIDGEQNLSDAPAALTIHGNESFFNGVGEMDISPTAERRAYEIGLIAIPTAFPTQRVASNVVFFFVNGATGPKCPRLASVTPEMGDYGTSATATFTGQYFELGATIQVSGAGLTVGPTTFEDSNTLSALLTVALDAQTGFLELRVVTSGGTSNRLFFYVSAPKGPPVIEALLPNFALRSRATTIRALGQNFHSTAKVVLIGKSESEKPSEERRLATVQSVSESELIASIGVPRTFPLGSQTLSIATRGGTADKRLRILKPGDEAPVLSSMHPQSARKGTNMYVACDGLHFARTGSGRSAFAVLAFGEGIGTALVVRPPVFPTELTDRVVFNLVIPPDAGPRATIGVVTPEVLNSNALDLTIDSPPPGSPTLTSFASTGVIDAGTERDDTVFGSNLQGVTELGFSIPGLTFTEIQVNPDGTAISFHVVADAGMQRTWQEATNLFASRADGDSDDISNEIGYLIR